MKLNEIMSSQYSDYEVRRFETIVDAKARLEWPNEVGRFRAFSNRNITSLEGVPKIVHDSFVCYDNEHLTSLVGGPIQVDRDYTVWGCRLTSYDGVAKKIC